ncbi:hypothetical protein EMIHUDRAFT_226441 [Emiliania huxleyi CCMP1516]|uniref:Uncharacterized protein n=2 Tax=Emiliania huxleyi TaxID=2903 RepID=A0A0D3KKW7_EMIH1|nr:hypothetical protein EMIHUDRAFT_226441 [Emiliania huxleyi CCMP1516]EOD36402.1 hypothetical protein EMIHUDRAFT_226441 [Emiliania huxleyi CCMP1516]|eukprot:XP_005788831.1 hypothetical protein EMIHUDRAFT_226441 [Emiliania huxleyi CCMP1516]
MPMQPVPPAQQLHMHGGCGAPQPFFSQPFCASAGQLYSQPAMYSPQQQYGMPQQCIMDPALPPFMQGMAQPGGSIHPAQWEQQAYCYPQPAGAYGAIPPLCGGAGTVSGATSASRKSFKALSAAEVNELKTKLVKTDIVPFINRLWRKAYRRGEIFRRLHGFWASGTRSQLTHETILAALSGASTAALSHAATTVGGVNSAERVYRFDGSTVLVIKTDVTYTVTHQTTHILPPAGTQNALDESLKKASTQQAARPGVKCRLDGELASARVGVDDAKGGDTIMVDATHMAAAAAAGTDSTTKRLLHVALAVRDGTHIPDIQNKTALVTEIRQLVKKTPGCEAQPASAISVPVVGTSIHGPCAEVERLGGLEGTKVGV